MLASTTTLVRHQIAVHNPYDINSIKNSILGLISFELHCNPHITAFLFIFNVLYDRCILLSTRKIIRLIFAAQQTVVEYF